MIPAPSHIGTLHHGHTRSLSQPLPHQLNHPHLGFQRLPEIWLKYGKPHSEFNLPLRGPAMEEHPGGAVRAAEATHK